MLTIGILDPTANYAWADCIGAFMTQLDTHWNNGNGTDYTIIAQGPNYGQTVPQALTNLVNLGRPNPADFIILTGGTGPTVACIQATQPVPAIKIFLQRRASPAPSSRR